MSRIGRMPVVIPGNVEVTINGAEVSVKGPKGTLTHVVAAPISVARAEDGSIEVSRPNDERVSRSLHGLTRTLISNMVVGVTDGYQKTLEISGTGYRVALNGSTLEFALGYSHPVKVDAPAGITFVVETPTRLHVQGIDKQKVGQVAAEIRAYRSPEPYKGKGVRYADEVVVLKETKKK